MLRKITQPQKGKYCTFSLICIFLKTSKQNYLRRGQKQTEGDGKKRRHQGNKYEMQTHMKMSFENLFFYINNEKLNRKDG